MILENLRFVHATKTNIDKGRLKIDLDKSGDESFFFEKKRKKARILRISKYKTSSK